MHLPGVLTEGELWDQEFSRREEQAKAEHTKLVPHLLVGMQGEQLNCLKTENRRGVLLTCSSKTEGFKVWSDSNH